MILSLYPKLNLEKIDRSTGRVYVNKDTNKEYPSVTTVLAKNTDNSFLTKWKNRVGEETANSISLQARNRGGCIHELLENYILYNKINNNAMPFNQQHFLSIKKFIDQNISEVYGVEFKLCSDLFNTAGTSDLIAKCHDRKFIIDYKTSRKIKSKANIKNYFIQSSVYGLMFNEIFQENIKDILIIMLIDHEEPMFFYETISNFRKEIKEIFYDNNPRPTS